MTFKTEVCSVALTSKISLPHHISLTKNGLSKRKETRFSLKEKTDDRPILVFNVQRAIFQLYSGREHFKNLNATGLETRKGDG
jgi:hypothetical protein